MMQFAPLLFLSLFSQSTSLQQTAQELQRITVPSADLGYPFPIDPQAAKLLPLYKRQIRQSLEVTLNKSPINGVNSAKLLSSLPTVDKSAYYGRILRVEILRSKLNTELLGLVVDIHVVQEPDSFFILYQRSQNQWTAIYEWDESTYTSTNMELWHLKTPQLTSGNAAKSFRILVDAESGSSANGGHLVRLNLLEFNPGGTRTQILKQQYYAKNYQVRLESNGLLFERLDYTSDGNGCCTSYPYRYKLEGTSMVREQPLGFDPNHFIASWGLSPWPEVEFAVDTSVRTKAKLFHDAYSEKLISFGENEYCDVRGLFWQVSVELESSGKPTKQYFLLERQGRASFVIKDFRSTPFENCRPSSSYPWPRTIFQKPLRW